MSDYRRVRNKSSIKPIWSCSRWGLHMQFLSPGIRCALTAPFHPYLKKGGIISVALSLKETSQFLPLVIIQHRVYMESGLSSDLLKANTQLHDHLTCTLWVLFATVKYISIRRIDLLKIAIGNKC